MQTVRLFLIPPPSNRSQTCATTSSHSYALTAKLRPYHALLAAGRSRNCPFLARLPRIAPQTGCHCQTRCGVPMAPFSRLTGLQERRQSRLMTALSNSRLGIRSWSEASNNTSSRRTHEENAAGVGGSKFLPCQQNRLVLDMLLLTPLRAQILHWNADRPRCWAPSGDLDGKHLATNPIRN